MKKVWVWLLENNILSDMVAILSVAATTPTHISKVSHYQHTHTV
jgi:hypothetical protein